jgi:hypothetical protein
MHVSLAIFALGGYRDAVLMYAAFIIPALVAAGFRGYGSVRGWRIIKLLSTLFGLFGLVALSANFVMAERASIERDSIDYLLAELIDLKSTVAIDLSAACRPGIQQQPPSGQTCREMTAFNDHIPAWRAFSTTATDRYQFDKLDESSPATQKFAHAINTHLDSINGRVPLKTDAAIDAADESRIWLYVLATIFLSTATACSAGETAFQIRADIKNAKARSSGTS